MAEGNNRRAGNQRYIRPGWYEARLGSGASRIVFVDNPNGYTSARQVLGVAPHYSGTKLDQLINEEENAQVIAPDDWESNRFKYGIGTRSPDTTEGEAFGRTRQYKNWKDLRNRSRYTQPPGRRHYGGARGYGPSPQMASHMRPFYNTPRDMRTQNQFVTGPHGNMGLMPRGYA